ncbi:MAG: class I SAM-dependent methyltransferase [Oligoflexia bacterium]|nr:class I SAM-dependent methyltransferase [Oligoflexia bacterium]
MKECEIRPKEIFEEYLRISRIDGENLDKSNFKDLPCPGCNSIVDSKLHFNKFGFKYLKCDKCNSLYCSPRPNEVQLEFLCSSSNSSKFWSTVFFPLVAERRRELMFQPKARMICDLLKDRNIRIKNICDVGAGHGFMLEEIKKNLENIELFAIEPDKNSARSCMEKGIRVAEVIAEKNCMWKDEFDLVVSFEVIEHVFNVRKFVKSMFEITKPNGYCLITGLGYEGYDILSLQENSKSISPPHHINFLSIAGLEILLRDIGFRNIEIITPGKLDVDIVYNCGFSNEFVTTLKRRGYDLFYKFQQFLVDNQLSSHVWAMAQK